MDGRPASRPPLIGQAIDGQRRQYLCKNQPSRMKLQERRHMKACMCQLCSSSGALECLTLLVSALGIAFSTLRAGQAFWLERRQSVSDLLDSLRELTRGAEC
jgi:hypothetical protein